jgi:hypothetical protein
MEYNNKYLKCLATVRLINKLFTTPQYIEEKLLVVWLDTLLESTWKSFRLTHRISPLSIQMSMVETIRLILSKVYQVKPWSTWKNKTRKLCLPQKE